jgi:predicted esterase
LYIPHIPVAEGATPTKHALMLMVHGGSFVGGSKSGSYVVASAREYAKRGWLVASIDYRLQGVDPVASGRVKALADFFGAAVSVERTRAVLAALDDTLTALDFLQARADVVPEWTTLWGFSAGAVIVLVSGYALDDHGIPRPPVAAVIEAGGRVYTASGTPFDDPTGSDPALMVIHGTEDDVVPFSSATQIQAWAANTRLPFDFEPVAGAGHLLDLVRSRASNGVSLVQRSVDFLHETVFAGLQQGPQPESPPGR